MKTKEFIKRVEELGFEAWISGSIAYVLKDGRYEVARIKTKRACAIDFFYLLNETLDKEISEKLFDIIVEYARTPIEDREEEKRFCLEHKNQRSVDGSALYFTIYISHNFLLVKSQVISENLKQKFTLKEIKEIKEKYDIDLADFELVEVENEG